MGKPLMKAVVVGIGSIGKRHLKNLSSLFEGEILLCTKKSHNLTSSKNHVFSSLEECIEQKPDIGFVTNITSLHIKTAISLAKAGCHIFIEKPLSNSTKDIKGCFF